jgi:hypothetical protein
MNDNEVSFSSALPIIVLTRPSGGDPLGDWQEFDRGPGYFHIPAGYEARIRMKTVGNDELSQLSRELANCQIVSYLDLSENRNITDHGMVYLKLFRGLTGLNLSSCSLSNKGLEFLKGLNLTNLDLSFCNRITDDGLKSLKNLPHLTRLNLQGCVKVTHNGIARISRSGLVIHI